MKSLFPLALVTLILMLGACGSSEAPTAAGSEHGAGAAAEFERGPHRGRLLRAGDFALEVTIFETGVPPEYRLYAYRDGTPVPPGEVRATIDLTRLDGEVDHFEFSPQGDVLVGDGTVVEPHSFDVVVTAQYAGKSHRWSYDSYEGRTTMPAAVAQAAGVRTETAGPATIHDRVRLMGRVALDSDRFAEVRSRFEGPVKEVRVALGDSVKAGQTLAIVENRESADTRTLCGFERFGGPPTPNSEFPGPFVQITCEVCALQARKHKLGLFVRLFGPFDKDRFVRDLVHRGGNVTVAAELAQRVSERRLERLMSPSEFREYAKMLYSFAVEEASRQQQENAGLHVNEPENTIRLDHHTS